MPVRLTTKGWMFFSGFINEINLSIISVPSNLYIAISVIPSSLNFPPVVSISTMLYIITFYFLAPNMLLPTLIILLPFLIAKR